MNAKLTIKIVALVSLVAPLSCRFEPLPQGPNPAIIEIDRIYPSPATSRLAENDRPAAASAGRCFLENGTEINTVCDVFYNACRKVGTSTAWDPDSLGNQRVVTGSEFMDLCWECGNRCQEQFGSVHPPWPYTVPWSSKRNGVVQDWVAYCPTDPDDVSCWLH